MRLAGNWSDVSLFFGSAMFAFSGVGVILPLENKMRYPERLGGWCGVVTTGMTFVSCLYLAMGFYGYLAYGEAVKSTGSVTLNLPQDEG